MTMLLCAPGASWQGGEIGRIDRGWKGFPDGVFGGGGVCEVNEPCYYQKGPIDEPMNEAYDDGKHGTMDRSEVRLH